MPELPEVETTKRGITPHIKGQVIEKIEVRQAKLRWPVPDQTLQQMLPLTVKNVSRRAKYLLIETDAGYLLLHLGMSGRLHVVEASTPPAKHDHVDFTLSNALCLRYHDPRRFGAVLWFTGDPEQHALLKSLGPEPLSKHFTGAHLHSMSRGRTKTVKEFVMDQKIVVGVGNIYAQEALFTAGIHPKRAAGKVSAARYELLVDEIKKILRLAITKGGTTLKDFLGSDGKPGYFSQSLQVYSRAGEACFQCGNQIQSIRLGNRASCYCSRCQT